MKKVLGLFLAALMLTALVTGCAQGGASTTTATANAGSTSQAESTAATPAGDGPVLKMGVVAPMSGAAGDGEYMTAAIQMAAEEINAAGGIGGKMRIEVIVEDDEGAPAKSVTVMQKLVNQDQVDIVLGAQNSSCTLANMVITQEAEIPQITPGSSSPDITKQGNPWIFRTSVSDATAAYSLLKYISEDLGKSNIAVLYDSSDFGANAYAMLQGMVEEYGINIILADSFNQDDKDFSVQLTKVQDQQPDVVLCWGYYAAASQICKQMKQYEIDIPFMGYGFNNPMFTELGAEWVEGAIVASAFTELSAANNDLIEPFADNFRAFYGKSPTQVTAQAYDTVYIVKDAVERMGVDEPIDHQKLRDEIAATSGFYGVCGDQTFDETGDVVKEIALVVYNEVGEQELLK